MCLENLSLLVRNAVSLVKVRTGKWKVLGSTPHRSTRISFSPSMRVIHCKIHNSHSSLTLFTANTKKAVLMFPKKKNKKTDFARCICI